MKKLLIADSLDFPVSFPEQYTHIRGYHGCRPFSIESYYKNGIKPLSKKEMWNETILRLSNTNISQQRIQEKFNLDWNQNSGHKSVWLTFSQNELINSCGHYLIYGSEFIMGIAAFFGCENTLTNVGIPTIFYCDVPIKRINSEFLPQNETNLCLDDFRGGFPTDYILPAEIIRHTCPDRIHDIHNNSTYCYP